MTVQDPGIELLEFQEEHNHSILVGKHCAYCMDCGQILLEYNKPYALRKALKAIDDSWRVKS